MITRITSMKLEFFIAYFFYFAYFFNIQGAEAAGLPAVLEDQSGQSTSKTNKRRLGQCEKGAEADGMPAIHEHEDQSGQSTSKTKKRRLGQSEKIVAQGGDKAGGTGSGHSLSITHPSTTDRQPVQENQKTVHVPFAQEEWLITTRIPCQCARMAEFSRTVVTQGTQTEENIPVDSEMSCSSATSGGDPEVVKTDHHYYFLTPKKDQPTNKQSQLPPTLAVPPCPPDIPPPSQDLPLNQAGIPQLQPDLQPPSRELLPQPPLNMPARSCASKPPPADMVQPPSYLAPFSQHSPPQPQESSSSDSESESDCSDHSSDPDYLDSSSSGSSSSEDEPLPTNEYLTKMPKYLVYEDSIRELLRHVRCQVCKAVMALPEGNENLGQLMGSALSLKLSCLNGHNFSWLSQPLLGSGREAVPAGNIMIPAAILFSGNNFGKVCHFANVLNWQFLSKTTYNTHQADYLFPCIHDTWANEQEKLWDAIREKGGLKSCGDARCDSPGHNAKYSTYSVMDMDTDLIVDMEVVQKTEVTSSNAMEKEGCRRLLDRLEGEMLIDVLATDRHLGIQKMMREDYDYINHQYDVWHLAKSVAKKLRQKAQKRDCGELMDWIPAIKTHLWWAAASCGGDAEEMLERWMSTTHHCTNNHNWGFGKFKKCEHDQLSAQEEEEVKWLKPGSPPHKALNEVLDDTRLKNDIKKLNLFCHTGQLENYHGFMLKYLPKRIPFSFEGMVARTKLAALDHNANVGRKQAVVTVSNAASEEVGTLRTQAVYSKDSAKVTSRILYEPKSYEFVDKLMADVVTRKQEQRKKDTANFILPQLPRNIIPKNVEVPSKQTLREVQQTRFQNNDK
ncbi:uncharacterized protein [Amphiura filiformis]|uniref:uncharacterized protein n=1 Tax=Amphiura filiformis TaxID=82378 RepID=UPI003B213F51